jgi:hypothetical protein
VPMCSVECKALCSRRAVPCRARVSLRNSIVWRERRSCRRVSGAPARACRSSRRDASRRTVLSQFVQAVLVGAVSVWGNRKERRSYVATTRRGGPGGAPGPNARKRQYPIPQTGTKAKHRGERPAARKRDPSRAERRRERERTFQTESTQNKTDPSSGKEQPTALFHRLF